MGLLATAMGLPAGKEGMKELTKRMKDGKIGMEELFKFLDMAASRAKETGAYGLAINSKQAAETRMSNSYKDFSFALGTTYDSSIKNIFQGLASTLENLTTTLKKSEEQRAGTGVFGTGRDLLDGFSETVMMLGEVLELAAEGWWGLYKAVTGQSGSNSTLKTFLADREMERNYFRSVGATTEQDKVRVRQSGMPGYMDYVQQNALKLGASPANAYMTSREYGDRAGLINRTNAYDKMSLWEKLSIPAKDFHSFRSASRTTDWDAGSKTVIYPSFHFTVANNDEADILWKTAMRELMVPYK